MRWLVLLFILTVVSCSRSEQRVLNLYTSLDAQEAPVYITAFEKDTGIRVQWTRLSAGEALARLEAEKHNPQVSVWFGGPSPEYIVATQRGLLEPFIPAMAHELDAAARAADGAWTGFYFGAIGFACNENFLREKKLSCPRSWQDLLDPALKGQISLAYPYTSGTAYVLVVSLLEMMGEAKGWDYIRKLDEQVHHYNSSGSAAVTQAGLGEVGVGIAFAHDILKKGKERGYPVILSVPADGAPIEIGAVALVKGGKQQDAGKEFIAWLLSERAQNLLAGFYRVPLNPNANVAPGAIKRSDIHPVVYDPIKAASDQKRILAKWREITGR
jgi:iron(III) transport system substrate-binding protein